MIPKQRNYNGYSLVHPHTRTDPYFHSKVPFLFNKRGLIGTAFLIALIVLRYSRGVLGDDSRNNDHDIDIH